MKELLASEWQAELIGVDLLYLEQAAGRFDLWLTLRADGTACCRAGVPQSPAEAEAQVAPFPANWDLSSEKVLSIREPVPPMPDYGIPDWTRNQVCYDVLSVTDLSLALSNRRFDGEHVIIFRRLDQEGYNRQQAV